MLARSNLIVILYSLPVYQQLFFTVQLISFKRSNPSRKFLGLLLLAMTLFLVINAVTNLGYQPYIVHFLVTPLILMILPFEFLYLLSLFNKNDHIKTWSSLILFIPALIMLIAELSGFGFSETIKHSTYLGNVSDSFSESEAGGSPVSDTLRITFLIIIITQIALSALRITDLVKSEQERVNSDPQFLPHISFLWIKIISGSLIIFLIASSIQIFALGSYNFYFILFSNILMLVSGGLVGYYGMKQDALMQEISGVGILRNFSIRNEGSGLAENESNIVDDETAGIINKIQEIMEEQKPYLSKKYTINDLSIESGIKQHRLTTIINDTMGTNFNGLVNNYRIKEAISMLEDNKHNYTIDAIADITGFSSRSTFYACFKKITGLTPKDYMLRAKNNIEETEM
ncbi:MAG: AraC family transcriptional regulator [Bacteroidales bacterium]